MSHRMPPWREASKNQSGRGAPPTRCGPRPAVCTTRPIAPAATSSLAEMAHIFNVIFSALHKRDSRYASVLGALIELSGETAKPVTPASEPQLDESWAEPEVFGGCSTQGQARPGQPQPIQIVKRSLAGAAPTSSGVRT